MSNRIPGTYRETFMNRAQLSFGRSSLIVGDRSLRLLSTALCSLLVFGAAQVRAASLLTNGDFETGDFSGWILNFTPPNDAAFITSWPPRVSRGKYAVNFSYREVPATAVLAQTFNTVNGAMYDVRFTFGTVAWTDRSPTLRFEVLAADGATVLASRALSRRGRATVGSGTEVVERTSELVSFTAKGASATLRFTDLTSPSLASDALLDEVSVTVLDTVPCEVEILHADFEDGSLDPRMSIERVGTFSAAPGIKSVTEFGSRKAFGFGRSTCGASCFGSYATTLKIVLPAPVFISAISFKEMERFDNWGSAGQVLADGVVISGGGWDFGRLPYNDFHADTSYRYHEFPVNKTASTVTLHVWDITTDSEIFLDDLVIKAKNSSPPNISAQPRSQTVTAGSDVSCSVEARSTTALSYQWRFNGQNLAGKTNAVLTLDNVQPSQAGNYDVLVTNCAGSTRSEVATLTVTPEWVTMSISDAEVLEGNEGTGEAVFTVSLSSVRSEPVTVEYFTVGGTATEGVEVKPGVDYLAARGTLRFAPGQTNQEVRVTIVGDLLDEEERETFTVVLTNALGAVLAKGVGQGTIADDDREPTLSITDKSVLEGNSSTSAAQFIVRLSLASGRQVKVDYETRDGTARVADNDYRAVSGMLVFAPGDITKTVVVPIVGDTNCEGDEQFYVGLTNAVNAAISDALAVGEIRNEDRCSESQLKIVCRDGTWWLELMGESGRSYEVQASTNVADWTNPVILTNVPGPLWSMPLSDLTNPAFGQRFYRAKEQ